MFEIRDGTPYSRQFDDIYFSREHGLEETEHVFLRGNNLPARWQGCDSFVIGETGFGTGLNFLSSMRLWANNAAESSCLHYISIEKYPLTRQQLADSLRGFPELDEYALALLRDYPLATEGVYRIRFDRHRVSLTLMLMDVARAMTEIQATVDCWFLDGFAPVRNPAMWDDGVCRALARLGRSGTTVATFTAAGSVKRNLQQAGFKVVKRPGFGAKREMIVAELENAPVIRESYPWSLLPPRHPTVSNKTALVIGAGIAGAQAARHLADRGYRVNVVERHQRCAMEASGNPVGVIAPRMTARPSNEEQFSVESYLYTLNQLRRLEVGGNTWSPCGVMHLANNPRKRQQWREIAARNLDPLLVRAVDIDEASAISGIDLDGPALYFPLAGWVSPPSLVSELLRHESVTLHYLCQVTQIQQRRDCWIVSCENGQEFAASVIVIAAGSELNVLAPTGPGTDQVGGQTSLAVPSDESRKLNTVIQHDGYITPVIDDRHLLGATYQRQPLSVNISALADNSNLNALRNNLPSLAAVLGPVSSGHAAIRCASINRFPIVGPVTEPSCVPRGTGKPRKNKADLAPGMYVIGALGSRGLTTAALCAELLCAEIDDEPLPVGKSLYRVMHSARDHWR